MKYLLNCSCGKSVPIETSQAGQAVACSCGKQLEAPTMRMIRQLEPASEEGADRATKSGNWSILHRLLFAAGLAVATAGFLVAGFYQWSRVNLDTKEIAWDINLDTDLEVLENMDLELAWENWLQVRDSGIGPYQPPFYIQSRFLSGYWKKFALGGVGVGVAGIALMGIAVLLSRKPAESPVKT